MQLEKEWVSFICSQKRSIFPKNTLMDYKVIILRVPKLFPHFLDHAFHNAKETWTCLPLKFWLDNCQSTFKSSSDIINTFSTFWSSEWIFLIKCPYLRILSIEKEKKSKPQLLVGRAVLLWLRWCGLLSEAIVAVSTPSYHIHVQKTLNLVALWQENLK